MQLYFIIGILIFILLLIILQIYIVNYYFSQVITRKTKSIECLFQKHLEKDLIHSDYFQNLKKEEVYIVSNDQLKLHGFFIPGHKNKDKSIIFVHGITVAYPTSIKYMKMFVDKGWNVIIYDQRRHGLSDGKYSTYGYYEKYDLDCWVNWLIKRIGKNHFIGIHGESMGGATVLQYATINKYVDFIISDCSYSDMNKLLEYRIKNDTKLCKFPLIKLTDLKTKRLAKFNFSDIKPINDIKDSHIPVLFIHGSEDKFVPTFMSEDMYKSKKGYKKLYICKGAKHAESIDVDINKYKQVVFDFIDDVIKIKQK